MELADFTYLITKPDAISERQTAILDEVIATYPYFQSAKAIQLKGLYSQNSFKYNNALKITAAYTTDRSVLFDFITSENFVAIHKRLYEKKLQAILDINVVDSEEIKQPEIIAPVLSPAERSILTSIKEAAAVEPKVEKTNITEKLEIGSPLEFSKKEQHSFQEWLQLSRTEPIKRDEIEQSIPEEPALDPEKLKKLAIIDKFIETSPKISPVKQNSSPAVNIELPTADHSALMTETLARVYLEQKKYQKAIQAYEILILKYPEKSSFFADRISDIKILQHNNN
ncbi:MAG: tetratricopeptide repeat protein [Flavobacterium sp.]